MPEQGGKTGRRAATFGQVAESAAEQFLRLKGYRILARNLRSRLGELDLVAESGDIVVFIEVKARRTSVYGGVSYAVSGRKQDRLIRLATQYLAQHRLEDRLCRFDVVLYHGEVQQPHRFEHIENSFDVPGSDTRW